jgi:hypothetical protein
MKVFRICGRREVALSSFPETVVCLSFSPQVQTNTEPQRSAGSKVAPIFLHTTYTLSFRLCGILLSACSLGVGASWGTAGVQVAYQQNRFHTRSNGPGQTEKISGNQALKKQRRFRERETIQAENTLLFVVVLVGVAFNGVAFPELKAGGPRGRGSRFQAVLTHIFFAPHKPNTERTTVPKQHRFFSTQLTR